MTTLNEAKEAVYARFVAQWGMTTPFVLDNEERDEAGDVAWMRLVVRSSTRAQLTLGRIGNRKFLSGASVFAQVYTPVNTGVQSGDSLAVQAANIFEGVSFSGLDFREAVVRESGPTGKWYLHVMEAEFDYEEIK